MNSSKEQNFEKQLQQLEEIVEKLDSSDVPLDESLKLYEEGIAIYRSLNKRITEAEQKIIDISKINYEIEINETSNFKEEL